MNSLIDWDSPTFGASGTNVHESSTGSWVATEAGEDQ